MLNKAMFLLSLIFGSIFAAVLTVCPSDFETWQSLCYYFEANATAFVNAEEDCIAKGGHLSSVHDGFTNAFLAQRASLKFVSSTTSDFWIGGTDLMIPGNFSWTDGTVFDFTDGKLQKNATGEDCISINISNGSWLTLDCFKLKPYVCLVSQSTTTTKLPTTTTATTTTTKKTTTTPPQCLNGWTYFEPTHSCYRDMGKASWQNAENNCQTYGAHLVSIHSASEDVFLQSLEVQDGHWFWIGLHSEDGGSDWNWTDFSPVNYTLWHRNNPSCCNPCANFGNKNLENSWYNDTPCDSVQPYVCKKLAYT